MEEHHVPLAQVAEHVAFLEQARDVPLDAGRLELGAVHIIKGHELGKAHGPLDAVDLEGLQAQAPRQEVHQLARGLVGDLQAHHIAEAALFHQVAHGFQQVVGLVFLDLQVGVAGDAEQGGADHRMPGEEQLKILGHEVFQQQDVITAHVGIEAQGGVGLGLLVARDEDEAREVVGTLQAHEARLPVAVAQLDDEIEAGGGDGGEGVPGVDGLGREHGVDLVAEIAVQETALLFRKVGIAHDAHAPFQQLRGQALEPVALRARGQQQGAAADLGQLLGRRDAVGRAVGRAVAVLAQDVGHADHEEFIKVVVEDGKEFELFQQGLLGREGFVQDLGVEVQPVDFPVEEKVGAGKVLHVFRRAGLLGIFEDYLGGHAALLVGVAVPGILLHACDDSVTFSDRIAKEKAKKNRRAPGRTGKGQGWKTALP